MQEILELDFELFHFINSSLSNSFFDFLLPILREKITWIPFYLFLAYFLISRFSKKGLIVFLFGCLTVGIADFTSSTLIKQNIKDCVPAMLNNHPTPSSKESIVGVATALPVPMQPTIFHLLCF